MMIMMTNMTSTITGRRLPSGGIIKDQRDDCNCRALKLLSSINSELDRRSRSLPNKIAKLDFGNPGTFVRHAPKKLPNATANEAFILQESWLSETVQSLIDLGQSGNKDVEGQRLGLLRQVTAEYQRLEDVKQQQWLVFKARHELLEQMSEADGPLLLSTERYFRQSCMPPLLLATIFLAVVLHIMGGIAWPDSHFTLAALRVIIAGSFAFMRSAQGLPSKLSKEELELLDDLPKDIRTALNRFDLAPDIVEYACCPACFSTYKPDKSLPTLYPQHCTYCETPSDDVCGEPLLTSQVKVGGTSLNNDAGPKPFKVFAYQPLSSWLARLFSRPDLETYMDSVWDPATSGDEWRDIWDATALHELKGPDGKPYAVKPPGAAHLVFSLFVDWFNPYGNKKAGKYKLENVYLVGLIPGPHEPKLHHMNNILRPLVNDLPQLWEHGILLGRTWSKPFGRLVRCALGPLICDLPALHKRAGFASYSAEAFCSFCQLPENEITNLNKATWPRRSWKDHLRQADDWKNARTQDAREKVFARWGLRWSELLCLPYWDVTKFTVLDAMHNLFLGEFQHHCRQVWGIDIKSGEKNPKKMKPHSPEQQAIEIEKGRRGIEKLSSNTLKQLRKGYVMAFAILNEVVVEGSSFTKTAYINALLNWYRENPGRNICIPTVLNDAITNFVLQGMEHPDVSKFCLLSKEHLNKIQADIKNTSYPSWMVRPPHNFGSPSHGKLKADQWRTVCTVSLVLSLVPMWGSATSTDKEKLLLHNFIDLVIAVEISVKRSTSPARIALYNFHMTRYLKTLRELFADHQLQPNHHLSLHLDECLSLFGPVHSWWAFPFERYNGIIRDLNSNQKPGEMEKSFLKYFCIGANLRAFASRIEFPQTELYDSMMKSFHRAFIEPNSSLLSDFLSYETTSTSSTAYSMELSEDVYKALLDRLNARSSPHQLQFIRWDSDCEIGWGFILDSEEFSRELLCAVQISDSRWSHYRRTNMPDIVHHRVAAMDHSTDETFLVVQEYESLSPSDKDKDPFLAFENLGAQLYYNRFKSHPCVLKLSDIVSHFSCLAYVPEDIGQECIIAKSLDRSWILVS
ncbi:hypothetical protein SERLA73DRAFT_74155 [Serpula lacrymans var. lacrymans S7.3]|uniref:DUF4218 domain-containing protein n=1 Tax=Serpula lacrymans var. lacrymans (strain S7.3) TaxID=936435 RepID=F8Q0S6_SERL3|nr:hypothetical protein SERLA73DRAFT_74155 [Serpula lacrymans var. lacrymans S7.3]